MKKILVMTFMFLSIGVYAQNNSYYGYEIRFSQDCNRSWDYNNLRFSKVIWKGIASGKLTVYSEPGSKASLGEIFDSFRFLMEQEYSDSFDGVIFNSQDSLAIMTPNTIYILSDKADTLLTNKDWLRLTGGSGSGIEFGYTLSYPEVLMWLEQSKAYWVNPYDVTDSTLFSNALQEKRYCYRWYADGNAQETSSGNNYCIQLVSDKEYLFTGISTRYANLSDLSNRAFRSSKSPLSFDRILINAFLQGKIKAYYPASNDEILPADFSKFCNNMKYGEMEMVEDDNGQFRMYEYSPEEMYGMDLLVVKYEMKSDPVSNGSYRPQKLMLGLTYNTNVKGIDIPLISFSFEECMTILEASGAMWYNLNNHADSCTIASAIKQNKICWFSSNLKDQDDRAYYYVDYLSDSAKYSYQISMPGCAANALYDRSISNVTKGMNGNYTGKYFPVDPALPVYLHYRGERMLSKNDDTTLTFLNNLSEYIVEKVLKGNLTAYTNDSLNQKLSNAEFCERMTVMTYLYDEDGNESIGKDTLSTSTFNVGYVGVDFFLNKGKLSIKDRSLRLVIPADQNLKGIEIPLATFSYAELTQLMKKDKKGKALLKQISSTQKQAKYVNVIDPYGSVLYSVWNENKDEQLKAINSAFQSYLQTTAKY